ncbi:hypothetical protein LguiA_011337 [Lonicera macranthoides]
MHAQAFLDAYIPYTCDTGQRRKPKGHPDEKLRELPEAIGAENRQNSWKPMKEEFLISDHPQTLRVIRH